MRLTRIQIEGFGSLQAMDLRFGPAMNLVVGPNEAGKSTLQEAIVTGLYGLHSSNSARTTLVERADRWRPWQGGDFGLALEFALEDGTQLRVERDLDAETVRVVDVTTGTDLSERFRRRVGAETGNRQRADRSGAGDRADTGSRHSRLPPGGGAAPARTGRRAGAGDRRGARPAGGTHPVRDVPAGSPGRGARAAQPSARDPGGAGGVRAPSGRGRDPGPAARSRAAETRLGGPGA